MPKYGCTVGMPPAGYEMYFMYLLGGAGWDLNPIAANNLQQSWRFDWEPPKAVLRDVWTIDWILGC
jgi:hypothetical protein